MRTNSSPSILLNQTNRPKKANVSHEICSSHRHLLALSDVTDTKKQRASSQSKNAANTDHSQVVDKEECLTVWKKRNGTIWVYYKLEPFVLAFHVLKSGTGVAVVIDCEKSIRDRTITITVNIAIVIPGTRKILMSTNAVSVVRTIPASGINYFPLTCRTCYLLLVL